LLAVEEAVQIQMQVEDQVKFLLEEHLLAAAVAAV
jgi:hypothetical protein